jgi:hypothetical protein
MPTIVDGTTGVDQIQDGTVTVNKIANGAVTDAKIAAMAAAKLSGRVPAANAPLGSVIQVVQAIKTDTFTASSSTFVNITGMSATITPSSTTSKILVAISVAQTSNNQNFSTAFRITRNGSAIGVGNAAGSRLQSNFQGTTVGSGDHLNTYAYSYLDSPASTSALTYQLQFAMEGGIQGAVNIISNGDSDQANDPKRARPSSTVILMEIAA